jgi:transcription factor 1
MEPEEKYVEPFIRPLLEAPGSAYRHTTLYGAHPKAYWPNYVKLLSDGELMPPRPSLAPDDPRAHEIDYSLLVTGNLARRIDGRTANRKVGFAELILQHMTWAGLARDLFHNRGPVRMLWWCSEAARASVLPEIMTATVTYNAAMSVCATVTPVVECPPEESPEESIIRRVDKNSVPRQETPSMVEESIKRLGEGMNKLGLVAPESRAIVWPRANAPDGRPGFKTPYAFDCQSIEKLTDATASSEKRWQRFQAAMATTWQQRAEEWRLMLTDLHYPQVEGIVQAAAKYSSNVNIYSAPNSRNKAILYADIFLAVIHLEVNYKQLEEQMTTKLKGMTTDGNPTLPEELVALRERILSHANDVVDNGETIYPLYHQAVEDQLAMFADPPRGIFNKRAYPSLRASSTDFLPEKAMSLLDIVPRTVNYTVPGLAGRGEVCAMTQEILKSMFAQRGQPLLRVLEQLAPSASTDLLPFLPTLQDPRKGGRLNPHHVIVRQITDEMVDELMQAWFEWPFRPPHGIVAGGSRGDGEAISMFNGRVTEPLDEDPDAF